MIVTRSAWLPAVVAVLFSICALAGASSGAQRASEATFGKLIVRVENLGHLPVERVTVLIRAVDGRTDSISTPKSGIVRFGKVRAGEVIVEAHDRIWIQRKKGAFIPWGVDTVKVVRGSTTRHVFLMSQSDPPALYR